MCIVSDSFSNFKFGVGLGSGLPAVYPFLDPVHGLLMALSFSSSIRSRDRELSSSTQGKTHHVRNAILSLFFTCALIAFIPLAMYIIHTSQGLKCVRVRYSSVRSEIRAT